MKKMFGIFALIFAVFATATEVSYANGTFTNDIDLSHNQVLSNPDTDYYYFRVGPSTLPGIPPPVFPSLVFGRRAHVKGHHGYDLSAGIQSAFVLQFLSLKAQYMYFTPVSKKTSFYFGVGPNVVSPLLYYVIPIPSIFAVEFTPGLEFNLSNSKKTFVQLDISQPVQTIYKEDYYKIYDDKYRGPSVGVSAGIGF